MLLIFISCLALSNWQFSRLQERKDLNNRIRTSMEAEPVEVTSFSDLKDLEYRPVVVSGVFYEKGEVLISGRSRDGDPGYNVVTPLYIDFDSKQELPVGPSVIFVNRGWIPQPLGDDIRSEKISRKIIEPKGGYSSQQKVSGLLRKNEPKALFGQSEQVGNERVASRIDTSLFKKVVSSKNDQIYSVWIQTLPEAKTQSVETFPKPLDKPELILKNHLSYALQWLAFAFLAVITWFVICKNAYKKDQKVKSNKV